MDFAKLKIHWEKIAQSKSGKRLGAWLRIAVAGGIIAVLIYQLSDIGWSDLWASRPRSAGYYLLLPVAYLLLPTTEAIIFRKLWGVRRRDAFMASLKKRTLNSDVLNYSGEVQFYLWARKSAPFSPGHILKNIKDNLIVSSAASVISAVLAVGLFIVVGHLDISRYVGTVSAWHVAGGTAVVLLAGAASIRFRRILFSLPGRTLASLLTIHVARYLAGWVVLVMQWWFVLPHVPFETWALLLTAIILVDRIPMLPSKDLVLAGVGIGMSPALNVPAAAIAGLLLIRTAFNKTMNFSMYALAMLRKRRTEPLPEPEEEEPVLAATVAGDAPLARAA